MKQELLNVVSLYIKYYINIHVVSCYDTRTHETSRFEVSEYHVGTSVCYRRTYVSEHPNKVV